MYILVVGENLYLIFYNIEIRLQANIVIIVKLCRKIWLNEQ